MTDAYHALLYSTLGSFWSKTLRPSDRPTARQIVRGNLNTRSPESALLAKLEDGEEVRQMLAIPFDPNAVIQAGGSFNDRERIWTDQEIIFRPMADKSWEQRGPLFFGALSGATGGGIPLASNTAGEFFLFPGGTPSSYLKREDWLMQPMYVVPVPEDRDIRSLWTPEETLLLGVDFYRAGRNTLCLRKDPRTLYPGCVMLAAVTGQAGMGSYRAALGTNYRPGPNMWAWVRGSASSTNAFEKAIAECAGLIVVEEAGTVEHVTANFDGSTTYVIGGRIYLAEYYHVPLQKDETVAAGHIIGGGVRVLAKESPTWYRQRSWASGLPLDDLGPVQGVTVPDTVVTATASTSGGHLRVQFPLQGDPAAVSSYWANVRRMEDISGFYLADALPDLANPGDTALINPLDFFMQSFLTDFLLVAEIDIRYAGGGRHEAAVAFARTNAPTGAVLLLV